MSLTLHVTYLSIWPPSEKKRKVKKDSRHYETDLTP